MVSWSLLSAIFIILECLLVTLALLIRQNLPWYGIVIITFAGLVMGIFLGEISGRFSRWVLSLGRRERFLPLLLFLYFVSPLPGMIAAGMASLAVVEALAPFFR